MENFSDGPYMRSGFKPHINRLEAKLSFLELGKMSWAYSEVIFA